jgi:hypothetical protein
MFACIVMTRPSWYAAFTFDSPQEPVGLSMRGLLDMLLDASSLDSLSCALVVF